MSDLRQVPSVDTLLNLPETEALIAIYGRDWCLAAIRQVQAELRTALEAGHEILSDDEILSLLAHKLAQQALPSLRPVINATGVILHTNLGRAPLSKAALLAIQAAAGGYSNLEFELGSGKRGKREVHATEHLIALTGAEDALVVNNNAAAVLLMLTALARRRKVAISRSQLVEIGGSFRIPEVMRQSGARLLEVGTTNRTNLADFEEAIEAGAAVLMLAHHSNFRIIGFTTEPSAKELADLAHAHGLHLVNDLGSGALLDTAVYGLAHEPTVQEALQSGSDLVSFSADKLLGGPQAGIIVGKASLIQKLRKHPLYRALRPDKLCLSALSATLDAYRRGQAALELPLFRMLARTESELHAQALSWCALLGTGTAIAGQSTVGGGSLPEETLPTWLFALDTSSPKVFSAWLRQQDPAIISRIQDDRILFDPRTVQPDEEDTLIAIIRAGLIHLEGKQ